VFLVCVAKSALSLGAHGAKCNIMLSQKTTCFWRKKRRSCTSQRFLSQNAQLATGLLTDVLGWVCPRPPLPMHLSVSKKSDWNSTPFVKVPVHLLFCQELHANSKLLLIFLINQVGYKPISFSTLDRCLNVHRSTRIRCMKELREHGFITGPDSLMVLPDPVPILLDIKKKRLEAEKEADSILTFYESESNMEYATKVTNQKRDFLQEATDAWNKFRPQDYQKIRRISAQLVKAIDCHMRELQVPAHSYDEFFAILKAGIEKSDFWSKTNSNKTLQSITGIGSPTDKKKANVYALFNDGVDLPAKPLEENDRIDTVVYPASYRKVIDEYEAAQHNYQQAHQRGAVTNAVNNYVIRTEKALVDLGLDPAKFRLKYGLPTWPTDTPEPKESRVVNWSYDDEYGYAF